MGLAAWVRKDLSRKIPGLQDESGEESYGLDSYICVSQWEWQSIQRKSYAAGGRTFLDDRPSSKNARARERRGQGKF